MHGRLVVVRLVTLVLFASVLGSTAGAAADTPCTITVQPGESLRAALDAAPEGALVCLPAGVWVENVSITKPLTLRGAGTGKTRIRGLLDNVPVIRIDTSGREKPVPVAIEGLTLSGGVGLDGPSLLVAGGADVRVAGCAISANGSGIQVWDHSRVTIADSAIADSVTDGIVLLGSSEVVLTHCTFSGNRWSGIAIWNSARATIAGCTFSDNTTGIKAVGTSAERPARLTVVACTFFENVFGMWVRGWTGAVVTGCNLFGNISGIGLRESAAITLTGNRIRSNEQYGIVVYAHPCYDVGDVFTGLVAGRANSIPGWSEPDGNRFGAACPSDLRFLMTEEGGEYDRRESP